MRSRLALAVVSIAAVAVAVAAVPAVSEAAVPKTGLWQSYSRSFATVGFEIRGPASRRVIRRVSVPLACRGEEGDAGWATVDPGGRVRGSGRFRVVSPDSFTMRGRFVRPNRVRVAVRTPTVGDCRATTRRYTVRPRPHPVRVRVGRYFANLGTAAAAATARAIIEVGAYGRMADVRYIDGTVDAGCSDGSRRSLPLAQAWPDASMVGPIGSTGRFDINAQPPPAGSTGLNLSGTFDGAALGGILVYSTTFPDGVTCKTDDVTMVGSLAFPLDFP